MAETIMVPNRPIPEYQDYLKIFFDAEFTGLRKDTELISIGLVSESGRYFYAEFNDFDQTNVNEWLKENVIDNLRFTHMDVFMHMNKPFSEHNKPSPYSVEMKDQRIGIKQALIMWLQEESFYAGKKIQFFTDCYAYDWVLLNDLICEDGLALNLPDFINYIPIDLCTAMYMNGIDPDINRETYVEDLMDTLLDRYPFSAESKHNSLWDAYVIWFCFTKILVVNKNCRVYEFERFEDAFKEAEKRIKEGSIQLRGERDHPKPDNYNFEDGV